MQTFESILKLVKELTQSQNEEQLQTAKEKLKAAVGEKSFALCYQLALNPEYGCDNIAERTYLNQFCRDDYNDEELEKMIAAILSFSISEGLCSFYIGELERALPGSNDYLFQELTDLTESPKSIIYLLRERNKLEN